MIINTFPPLQYLVQPCSSTKGKISLGLCGRFTLAELLSVTVSIGVSLVIFVYDNRCFILLDDDGLVMITGGQFRTKKTGFEVTVSELIFLGQNMLVRPHEVHWGQFQLSPVILGAFLGPVGFLGPWEGQISK